MYLVRTAAGTYEAGGWFDAGWWGGLVLIAIAAWQPAPARRLRGAADSLRLIAAPLVSGAVALELLVYGSLELAQSAGRRPRRRRARVRDDPADAHLPPERRDAARLPRRGADRLADRPRQPPRADARAGRGASSPATPLVLALFDLDGFKHYNDTFGHPAGDVLLSRLGGEPAQVPRRPAGRVFRMGGDEFCALFAIRAGRRPCRGARRRRAGLERAGRGLLDRRLLRLDHAAR